MIGLNYDVVVFSRYLTASGASCSIVAKSDEAMLVRYRRARSSKKQVHLIPRSLISYAYGAEGLEGASVQVQMMTPIMEFRAKLISLKNQVATFQGDDDSDSIVVSLADQNTAVSMILVEGELDKVHAKIKAKKVKAKDKAKAKAKDKAKVKVKAKSKGRPRK